MQRRKWRGSPWWHDPKRLFGSHGGSFACGGAGTVLSRAAVRDTDFASCSSRFAEGCFQSDWMIGRCVEQAGVVALKDLSCGLCANACKKSMHNLLHAVRSRITRGECAFAQFEVGLLRSCTNASVRERSLGKQVCEGAGRLAISHGFPQDTSLCQQTVAAPVHGRGSDRSAKVGMLQAEMRTIDRELASLTASRMRKAGELEALQREGQ